MIISILKEYYLKTVLEGHADVYSKIIRKMLYLFSKIYESALATRMFFYKKGIFKSIPLPVPVISVGNITMGGTGKTPVVEYISKYLQKKGKRVAILSRGYAARIKQNNQRDEGVCNDEHLLLRENIPEVMNLLNKDRVKSGLEAIQHFKAECLLLDDGFQHLRLARDLDIVIIDALNPFGYEQIIPRGMLREPLKELRRASMIMLTHVDQCGYGRINFIASRLQEFAKHIPVIQTVHKPIHLESIESDQVFDVSNLNGRRVFAFCAIGNPASFRKSIEDLGAKLTGFHIFPDHHIYTSSELRALNREAQSSRPDMIIITQKDKVKIMDNINIWDIPVRVLKVEICIIKGQEIFENTINAILN